MEKFVKVDTEYGAVKGIRKSTILGMNYISFQGIPYMKAPIGKLRFRDAEPPEKWSEFDATGDCPSYVCEELFTNKLVGQEDAGIINVFTKDIKSSKLLPVMVWIHGGGFYTGSSCTTLYGPDYILQKDVILVSINYRLGALGFLSFSDPDLKIPGNAGLKDQTFALKWVQRNIENFGGDKNNVTIFGESAGGASVHYHMISDHSKGLFKRAITMSGVASSCWANQKHHNYAKRLADLLEYDGEENDKDILSFLETADINKIVKLSSTVLTPEEIHGEKIFSIGPCIEPYVSANCFIPKSPIELAREAWSNGIDCLIGGTSNEGIAMALDPTTVDKAITVLKNNNYFVPLSDLGLKVDDPDTSEYGKIIKQIYYGSLTPSKTNLEAYMYYMTDLYFWHSIQRTVLSRAAASPANNKGKTFLYRYDVVTELNFIKKIGNMLEYPGSEHSAEIFHTFKGIYGTAPSIDSKEFENIKKTIAIWTNFAIYGNPNCPEIGDSEWLPVESTSLPLKCLNIGTDECKYDELPETERLSVWNSIYKKAGVDLF